MQTGRSKVIGKNGCRERRGRRGRRGPERIGRTNLEGGGLGEGWEKNIVPRRQVSMRLASRCGWRVLCDTAHASARAYCCSASGPTPAAPPAPAPASSLPAAAASSRAAASSAVAVLAVVAASSAAAVAEAVVDAVAAPAWGATAGVGAPTSEASPGMMGGSPAVAGFSPGCRRSKLSCAGLRMIHSSARACTGVQWKGRASAARTGLCPPSTRQPGSLLPSQHPPAGRPCRRPRTTRAPQSQAASAAPASPWPPAQHPPAGRPCRRPQTT